MMTAKYYTESFSSPCQIKQALRLFYMFCLFAIMGCFYGCATGSTIVTGAKRPPIAASDVKLYLDPPAKYENIGIVEVASKVAFSRQAAQDKAMEALKTRAAKVGANGVLLMSTGSQTTGSGGYYSGGVYYGGGTSNELLAQGRAIYVTEE